MNSCWQVARTYVPRIRFWALGAIFLMTTYGVAASGPPAPIGVAETAVFFSVTFAGVLLSLAAFHLRRLLSGPAVHVIPGMVAPHLVVGALVAVLVCGAVPALAALWLGVEPMYLIGLHALAAILYALVLLWPPAVLLIALGPVAAVWVARELPGSTLLWEYFVGQRPGISLAVILLAIISYPAAALLRLRTRDRLATFSDDLSLSPSQPETGPFKEFLLLWRDGAIEHSLVRRGPGWQVRRWQVPALASWTDWALLVVIVVVVALVIGLATRHPEAAFTVIGAAGFMLLLVPTAAWRLRCSNLAGEFMRPVSRGSFVRQFLAAMIGSFAAQTILATLVSLLGYLYFLVDYHPDVWTVLWHHVLLLWAAAIWLYGLALATLHLRYWLPWYFFLLVVSAMAIGLSVAWLVRAAQLVFNHRVPSELSPEAANLVFFTALAMLAGLGLAAGWWTYRRWLEMDVV